MMQAALVRVRRTAAAEAAWARVIVALLPLLGLLGTVTGMIESFETLSAAGGSDPGGLTGGISAALLTTLAGLVTALPGVFAVHRLERRTDRPCGPRCAQGCAGSCGPRAAGPECRFRKNEMRFDHEI